VSLDSLHLARIGACDQKGPMINAISVSPLACLAAQWLISMPEGIVVGGGHWRMVAAKDRRVTSCRLASDHGR
jgi:hypothetical protein